MSTRMPPARRIEDCSPINFSDQHRRDVIGAALRLLNGVESRESIIAVFDLIGKRDMDSDQFRFLVQQELLFRLHYCLKMAEKVAPGDIYEADFEDDDELEVAGFTRDQIALFSPYALSDRLEKIDDEEFGQILKILRALLSDQLRSIDKKAQERLKRETLH